MITAQCMKFKSGFQLLIRRNIRTITSILRPYVILIFNMPQDIYWYDDSIQVESVVLKLSVCFPLCVLQTFKNIMCYLKDMHRKCKIQGIGSVLLFLRRWCCVWLLTLLRTHFWNACLCWISKSLTMFSYFGVPLLWLKEASVLAVCEVRFHKCLNFQVSENLSSLIYHVIHLSFSPMTLSLSCVLMPLFFL